MPKMSTETSNLSDVNSFVPVFVPTMVADQEIPVEKTVASKISADDQEISDEKTVAPAPKRTDEKMAPKVVFSMDITTCPFCGGDLENKVVTTGRVTKVANYIR